MIRPRFQITMRDGEKVELLFSVTVFSIAKRKQIDLSLEDSSNVADRLRFFAKIFYLGALNAWEFRQMDEPSLGDMPYKAIDFAEWMESNPKECARLIRGASAAISGQDLETGEADSGKDEKKK